MVFLLCEIFGSCSWISLGVVAVTVFFLGDENEAMEVRFLDSEYLGEFISFLIWFSSDFQNS